MLSLAVRVGGHEFRSGGMEWGPTFLQVVGSKSVAAAGLSSHVGKWAPRSITLDPTLHGAQAQQHKISYIHIILLLLAPATPRHLSGLVTASGVASNQQKHYQEERKHNRKLVTSVLVEELAGWQVELVVLDVRPTSRRPLSSSKSPSKIKLRHPKKHKDRYQHMHRFYSTGERFLQQSEGVACDSPLLRQSATVVQRKTCACNG